MFSDESSFYLQSPHAIGYFKNDSRNQAIKYMLHKEEFIDNHDFYDDRFNFENKYEKKTLISYGTYGVLVTISQLVLGSYQ